MTNSSPWFEFYFIIVVAIIVGVGVDDDQIRIVTDFWFVHWDICCIIHAQGTKKEHTKICDHEEPKPLGKT